MAETVRITIRYIGRDVENGTMSIEDVAEALSGLSGAYGKVAYALDPKATHQLRLTGIDTHSFDLLVLASMLVGSQGGDTLDNIKTVVDAAKHVIGIVVDVIRAKKHTQGKPFTVSVKGNNNVTVVINADGAELAIPPEAINLLKSKLIDPDLRKISQPLESDRIDAAEISADDGTQPILGTSITSAEKEYFALENAGVTTRETEIIGRLVSLNKERNKGTFRLRNNLSVPYQYIGENREEFHSDFSHAGPVKAKVIAEFNEDLSLIHIDILRVEPLQARLELPPAAPIDLD